MPSRRQRHEAGLGRYYRQATEREGEAWPGNRHLVGEFCAATTLKRTEVLLPDLRHTGPKHLAQIRLSGLKTRHQQQSHKAVRAATSA